MTYVYGAIFCGSICLIGQAIYDHTKLTAGHITSLFVTIGVLLDFGGLYDKLLVLCGAGASLPITSFGHSLIHGAILESNSSGILGLFKGMFSLTTAGITSAIIFSFLISVIFRSKS